MDCIFSQTFQSDLSASWGLRESVPLRYGFHHTCLYRTYCLGRRSLILFSTVKANEANWTPMATPSQYVR